MNHMQKLAAYLICVVLIITGYIYSETLKYEQLNETEVLTRGIVLNVQEIIKDSSEESYFPNEKEYEVELEITKGQYKGRQVTSIHYEGDNPAFDFSVLKGDEVVLGLEIEDFVLKNVYIASSARDKYLYYLFAAFVVSILLIGARQGLKTVLSLTVTGWAVVKILLPAILAGKSPIAITVIVCAGITIITLMLISGFTRKALSAIVGTIIGVLLGGVLAKYVITLTRVNGLGSEEGRLFFYSFAEGKLDFAGILFAGIVIGALGAVMDVAMSISSSINEIHQVKPGLSFKELVKSGLNIGRDIIGTMANTLILAYTGSSMSLMLLIMANNIPYLKYINLDVIATEIIRALSGSIGLFMAVPVTALISAALCQVPNPNKRPAR
ncbi:MAG: YibE/F family protein [Firmicutes bacterium HGW-Firmicutes-12]|nr:MAG: YibE/F family protein [Firmicutes bacterium HGW-Firmicutes-12]